MKKFMLLLITLIISLSANAQNWDIKFSGSFAVQDAPPTMILDPNTAELTLTGYTGAPGFEMKIGIVFGRMEVDYTNGTLIMRKEQGLDKGEVRFTTNSTTFSLYGWDVNTPGFNVSFGYGMGISHLRVNTSQSGTPEITDGVAYAKESHYELGLHYRLWENSGLSMIYSPRTFKTVTGNSFTNNITSLSAFYLY